MTIRSLLFLATCSLLLTGFVLDRAGWFRDKSSASLGRHPVLHAHATTQDLFSSESGWRYRTCEPRHWKYLMLKH